MNLVNAAKRFDREERKKGNSPPELFQRILASKTQELCRELKADENLALVGAYLMDIKVGQALREGRVKDHIEMSWRAAKKFLRKHNVSEPTQKKIENIIKAHHGTVPYESSEAEIVANADCFKFLHPRGALFFLTDLGTRGMSFLETLEYFEKKVEEKYQILSLDVCKEEAEEYYQLLHKLIILAKKK